MQQRSSTSISRALAICGLAFAAGISGCNYKPGGPLESIDRYTYTSTPYMAQNVTLIDTTKGETVWACEVPVGQQLVIKFINEGTDATARGTDVMRWSLMPIGSSQKSLENEIVCPPAPSRRVDGTLRESPEAYPTQRASVLNNSNSPGPFTDAANAEKAAKAKKNGVPVDAPAPAAAPEPAPAPAPAPEAEAPAAPAPVADPAPAPAPAGDPPVDLPD